MVMVYRGEIYKSRSLTPLERIQGYYNYTGKSKPDISSILVRNSWQAVKTYNHAPLHTFLHKKQSRRIGGIDIGGPFLSHKVEVTTGTPVRLYKQTGTPSNPSEEWFNGNLVAHTDISGVLNRVPATNPQTDRDWLSTVVPSNISDQDLTEYGSIAIDRCKPTNPVVDLSVTLAELKREGIPHLPSPLNHNPGSEYLNYQFGIAPLISDGRDLVTAIRDGEELIAQHVRDAGKRVRRFYKFPRINSYTVTTQTFKVPVSYGGSPSGQLMELGTVRIYDQSTTDIWFNGAFTYYIPDDPSYRVVSKLDRRYGIKPGYDTAWNLTPWSWLVDWNADIGNVISNINSFTSDGLVMPYGYVMATQRRERKYEWQGRIKVGNVWQTVVLRDTRIDETKQRQQASPFGFGLTDSEVTSRQKLILAALGLSKF